MRQESYKLIHYNQTQMVIKFWHAAQQNCSLIWIVIEGKLAQISYGRKCTLKDEQMIIKQASTLLSIYN